ncbi:MAG: hypothetical protein M3P04_14305, partial [Actinomycetota bacterium]|nr:hypothetical protein [Actinomycetota bacterium]
MRAAFASAVAGLVKQYGANPATWHKPALCARDVVDCDSNNPVTAGAIATPPQPFENRGTFHQAVEIFP